MSTIGHEVYRNSVSIAVAELNGYTHRMAFVLVRVTDLRGRNVETFQGPTLDYSSLTNDEIDAMLTEAACRHAR